MADAGFRLTVEGEKEFKAALQSIDQQIKINKAQIKLLTQEYNLNEDGMQTLTTKQSVLQSTYDEQAKKVAALDDKYKEMAATYGETDKRVAALKVQLLDASTAMAKTEEEIKQMRCDHVGLMRPENIRILPNGSGIVRPFRLVNERTHMIPDAQHFLFGKLHMPCKDHNRLIAMSFEQHIITIFPFSRDRKLFGGFSAGVQFLHFRLVLIDLANIMEKPDNDRTSPAHPFQFVVLG